VPETKSNHISIVLDFIIGVANLFRPKAHPALLGSIEAVEEQLRKAEGPKITLSSTTIIESNLSLGQWIYFDSCNAWVQTYY
jgi:O-succinylbenzoate synthase